MLHEFREKKQPVSKAEITELNNKGELALNKGEINEAWRYFYQSLEGAYYLNQASQYNEFKYELAISLIKFGDVSFQIGNFNVVRKVYDEALVLVRDHFRQHQTVEIKNGLAILLLKYGQMISHFGEFSKAVRSCNESLELTLQLWTDSKNGENLRCLAEVYSAMGRLALLNDDYKKSSQASQKARKCFYKLYSQKDGSQFQIMQDEANYHELAGADALLRNKGRRAQQSYEAALRIRRRLMKLSETPYTMRDLTVTAGNIGAAALCRKKIDLAIDAYSQALEGRKQLNNWLQTASTLRDLSIAHLKLSVLFKDANYIERAEHHHADAKRFAVLYKQNADDCDDVRKLIQIIERKTPNVS